jgi:hypothetical protein
VHVVGISKTTYVLATAHCLHWRHDSILTISTNNEPPDWLAPCRRPDSRHNSYHRSPWLPVAAFVAFLGRITLVFLGRIALESSSQ